MSSRENTKALEGLIGQVIHDRFRVEALLGRGKFGVVYRATDLRDSRQVAIKIVKYDLAEKGLQENFKRDAELIASLKHAGAVEILEYGSLNTGGGYFVMEFIEGKTLRDLIKEQGRLPYERALKLLRQVCEPIAAAHKLGIQHRDLKPENIVLPAASNGEKVMVADFGLVKLKEGVEKSNANLTAAGEVMGTPSYMSPEQCVGAGVDERTDLYSLGIILYEMLCGKPPFEGNFFAVLQMHMSKPVPPIRQQIPDLPNGVEALLNQLLDKEKDHRPASIDELIKKIDALVQNAGAAAPIIPALATSAPVAVSAPVTMAATTPQTSTTTSANHNVTSEPKHVQSNPPTTTPANSNIALYVIAAIVIVIGLLAVGHWGLKLF